MDWIWEPWPWYVSGPLIAVFMLFLLFSGKRFGMSSNLKAACSAMGAGKRVAFFDYDWKSQGWNLLLALGAVLGGYLGAQVLSKDSAVDLNPKTVERLEEYGFTSAGKAYLPERLFGMEVLGDPQMLLYLVLGGFFVGFGARYAGGCTSGHAISGLSDLQLPSLLAVVGFFIGGLTTVHLLFPLLF